MKMEELLGNFWGLLGKTLGRILKERLFEKSFWGLFERVFEEDFVKCWSIFLNPKTQSFLVSFVCFSSYQKSVIFTKSYYLELFNPFLKLFLLEKTIFEYGKFYILHDFRACNVLVSISWFLLLLALFPFCGFLSCCVKKCLTSTMRWNVVVGAHEQISSIFGVGITLFLLLFLFS